MADFPVSEINEAKKRVQEMRERAREFVNEEPQSAEPEKEEYTKSEPQSKEPPKQEKSQNNSNSPSDEFDMLGSLFSGEDRSKIIILALILILSHEKADNMLILALLYILL